MDVIILQYESRQPSPYVGFINNVNDYAQRHGYTHIVVGGDQRPALYPPYYAKVIELTRFCHDPRHHGTLVLFLDVDCVVADPNVRLEDIARTFLGCTKHILYAGNHERFNAGHLLLRNTPESRRVLDAWSRCYDPRAWRLDYSTETWSCHNPDDASVPCKWSERYYEQGDFKIFIMRDPLLQQYLTFDPDHYVFKSCDTSREGTPSCFILHLCAGLKHKTMAVKAMQKFGMPHDVAMSIVRQNAE